MTHSNPLGPYGYVRPKHGPGSRFDGAHNQMQRASEHRAWSAQFLADEFIKTGAVDEYDERRYRRDAAAAEYARAVYDVEAEAIR